MIAARPVAGVVMLAPGSRPLMQMVAEQMRYLGRPEEEIKPIEAGAKKLLAGEMKPE